MKVNKGQNLRRRGGRERGRGLAPSVPARARYRRWRRLPLAGWGPRHTSCVMAGTKHTKTKTNYKVIEKTQTNKNPRIWIFMKLINGQTDHKTNNSCIL